MSSGRKARPQSLSCSARPLGSRCADTPPPEPRLTLVVRPEAELELLGGGGPADGAVAPLPGEAAVRVALVVALA